MRRFVLLLLVFVAACTSMTAQAFDDSTRVTIARMDSLIAKVHTLTSATNSLGIAVKELRVRGEVGKEVLFLDSLGHVEIFLVDSTRLHFAVLSVMKAQHDTTKVLRAMHIWIHAGSATPDSAYIFYSYPNREEYEDVFGLPGPRQSDSGLSSRWMDRVGQVVSRSLEALNSPHTNVAATPRQ